MVYKVSLTMKLLLIEGHPPFVCSLGVSHTGCFRVLFASSAFVSFIYWVNLSKRGGKEGVFQGAALPARGKPRPSWLFYSNLHSISNTVFQSTEVSRRVRIFSAISVHFWWQIVNSDTTFFSWIFCAEYFLNNYFVLGPMWKVVKKL